MSEENLPRTLQQAIQFFTDEDHCVEFVAALRWPDGAICPQCGKTEPTYYLPTYRRWNCRECRRQFSVKTGTIFEDSPIPLNKWVVAVWLIAAAKNGISSYEVHRALGITQKAAWHMMHRVRLAMQHRSFDKFGGEGDTVELDETFIGGLSRFMHKEDRARKIKGTGGAGKTAVFGLLERNTVSGKSKVRAHVVENRRKSTLMPIIKDNVHPGSNIYTDELLSYRATADDYYHAFVNHAEQYVDGNVHTNGIENFWALLKRCIKGTYVSVEPFHLFRYLDEECFRFNERFGNDVDRFMAVMRGIVGKRLTYRKLTGKEQVVQV